MLTDNFIKLHRRSGKDWSRMYYERVRQESLEDILQYSRGWERFVELTTHKCSTDVPHNHISKSID